MQAKPRCYARGVPYRKEPPVGTTLAPDRRRLIMLVQVLCGLAVGAALAGSGQYLVKQRAQHRLEDPLRLEGSTWTGSMGTTYPFTLRIDSVRDGAVEGTMVWPGWGTTRVQGTLRGEVLTLVDYAVVSGNVPIGDKKVLIVRGSSLDGTDKNGSVAMHATRKSL
ncbi:MAG: hypothetical protein QOI41_761 [Myxococcales bacterium]|nr:hypothetical protein [Myxococcales bacterium]